MAAVVQAPVPKEFPSILKALTRELLRSFPNAEDQTEERILAFGADYFTEILEQIRHAELSAPPKRMSIDELRVFLEGLFFNADQDGSGALSLWEFKDVISGFQTEFEKGGVQLTQAEMRNLLSEADINGDGEIDYNEFLPLALDFVQGIYVRMDMVLQEQEEMESAENRATAFLDSDFAKENHLVKGMTKEEVDGLVRETFQKHDVDSSGTLDAAEFHRCLEEADLGLKRKEINKLMLMCDVDQSGGISLEEFQPVCFEMMQRILAAEIRAQEKAAMEPSQVESELQSTLIAGFQDKDPDNIGQLPLVELRECMLNLDLGLTRFQMHSVLALAEVNSQQMVSYEDFAIAAAEFTSRLLDPEVQKERHAILSSSAEADTVHGFSEEQVAEAVLAACRTSDPSHLGYILMKELTDALANCDLNLSQRQITGLMSTVTQDATGMVPYQPVADIAFKLLHYLAKEEIGC